MTQKKHNIHDTPEMLTVCLNKKIEIHEKPTCQPPTSPNGTRSYKTQRANKEQEKSDKLYTTLYYNKRALIVQLM